MPPDRAWHALAHLLGHWALRGYGMWAVTDRTSGEVLGRVGLYNPEGWPALELGWLLDRSRWGKGLATEAAQLATAWAWEMLEVDQLIHLIRPDNHASIRVAEKLGSTFTHRMDIDGGPVVIYPRSAVGDVLRVSRVFLRRGEQEPAQRVPRSAEDQQLPQPC